jgi:hypothetical protein
MSRNEEINVSELWSWVGVPGLHRDTGGAEVSYVQDAHQVIGSVGEVGQGSVDQGGEQVTSETQVEAMVEMLKAACDREWKNETPIQVAAIAANAIYWRDAEIKRLNDVLASAQRDVRETIEALEGMRR